MPDERRELTSPASRARAAAQAALAAGHLAQARDLVDAQLVQERRLVDRVRLLQLRARLTMWCGPVDLTAWQQLLAAADEVEGEDTELAAHVLCDAAVLAAYTRQLPLAEGLAHRAHALTGGRGDVGALAAVDLGIAYGLTGRGDQARPLLDRVGELQDADVGIVEAAELQQHVVLALVVQERYDEAVAAASRFLTSARPLGAVGLLPLPLCLLAHAAWKAGAWDKARLAAAEALVLAKDTREPVLELYAQAMLALVAGGQGREDPCRERVEAVRALSDRTGVGMFRVTAHMALVHLALGLGRPQEALQPLTAVEGLMGGARRVGMLNWHADRIDVLVQLGRHDDAHAVLAQLSQDAGDSRWEAAVLPRCRGQLEADDAVALQDLRASVAALAWQPYEQARSRLRLAERLRAVGDEEAADQARLAHAAFVEQRAHGWAAQAHALCTPAPAPAPPRAPAPAVVVPADGGTLELRLLGGVTVLSDGVPVPVAPGTGLQALKYVALHDGRASTDALVEALWPGAEPGRGRTRLRNVLTRLRKEGRLLLRDGDDVVLPEGAVVDAALFADRSARALAGSGPESETLARAAVDLYAGELLPGDRYLDWTSGPRERLRGRYLQLLDRLAAECAARDEVDEALSWHERAVDVEPYDEDRYAAMAALLLQHGRTGPAHRVVRRGLAMLDKMGLPASQHFSALASQVGA